jgi:hypothetical protein
MLLFPEIGPNLSLEPSTKLLNMQKKQAYAIQLDFPSNYDSISNKLQS